VTREGVKEPYQFSVNDYVEVEGRPLVTRLTYWMGDTSSDRYVDVLHRVVGTLRVVVRM
jgi:hypothetical protein